MSAAHAVSLSESVNGKQTGLFEGTCDSAGVIRGSWTKPDKSGAQSFELAPVGALDVPLVAARRKRTSFAPKKNPDPSARECIGFCFEKNEACIDEARWPEVFGAGSATVEADINQRLRLDKPVLEPAALEQAKQCAVGERAKATRSFEVALNASGLLAVRSMEVANYEGGTHPWDPGKIEWTTIDIKTGAVIDRAAIFDPSASAKLRRLVDQCVTRWQADMTLEGLLPSFGQLLVGPTTDGVSFAGFGYPPPARVLEGDGPTIRWEALLAEGLLRKDSPAARLWADRKPLAPRANPCVATAKK